MSDIEWHRWRNAGIGASDVPAILGLSPWAGRWSVWARKVGIDVEDRASEQMLLGHYAEHAILAFVEDRHGARVVKRQERCEHALGWPRCTLDGVLDAPSGPIVVECKSTSSGPDAWADGPPRHYWAQVQWQLFVTGMREAIIAVLHADHGLSYSEHEVERDDEWLDWAFGEIERFWAENVLAGVAPPMDATRTSLEIVDSIAADEGAQAVDLGPLRNKFERMVKLKREANALYTEVKVLEAEVKAALGEATVGLLDGRVAVTWKPQKRASVSASALRQADPVLYESLATTSETRVFRLGKEWQQWDD